MEVAEQKVEHWVGKYRSGMDWGCFSSFWWLLLTAIFRPWQIRAIIKDMQDTMKAMVNALNEREQVLLATESMRDSYLESWLSLERHAESFDDAENLIKENATLREKLAKCGEFVRLTRCLFNRVWCESSEMVNITGCGTPVGQAFTSREIASCTQEIRTQHKSGIKECVLILVGNVGERIAASLS